MSTDRVMFDFSGCRVLVTGGTNGIGAGIARAFHEAGAEVVITGTRASVSDYPGDHSGYTYQQLVLPDKAGIERVAGALATLDVLVNNAGQTLPGGQSEYIPEVFEESVAINLLAAFRLSQACYDKLRASKLDGGASIINLASMSSSTLT